VHGWRKLEIDPLLLKEVVRISPEAVDITASEESNQ
jgi:hypothetical protein